MTFRADSLISGARTFKGLQILLPLDLAGIQYPTGKISSLMADTRTQTLSKMHPSDNLPSFLILPHHGCLSPQGPGHLQYFCIYHKMLLSCLVRCFRMLCDFWWLDSKLTYDPMLVNWTSSTPLVWFILAASLPGVPCVQKLQELMAKSQLP